MKRFLPVVEAPYGMPLKIRTSSTMTPRTLPDDVSATTDSGSAALANGNPARSTDDCFRKVLRLVIMGQIISGFRRGGERQKDKTQTQKSKVKGQSQKSKVIRYTSPDGSVFF